MRRPLATIGFTFLLTLIAASFLGLPVNAALSVFFVVCAVIAFLAFRFTKKSRAAAIIFLASAVALASYCLFTVFFYNPVAVLDSETATLDGVITDYPQQSGNQYVYFIKTKTIAKNGSAKRISAKIRIAFNKPLTCRPYDFITVSAKLYLPSEDNGMGYDSRAYYRSKGVYLFAKPLAQAVVTGNRKPPIFYYTAVLKQKMLNSIYSAVGGGTEGGLAAGILLGDVSRLDGSVKQDFTTDGISHILAVSGTQTSLIAQCLLLLLCFLKVPRKLSCVVSIAAVGLFMAVTGFSASVSRAGIMSILYLFAYMMYRESDALTSLGASVLILCLINPFAAMDTGLLLSFSATFGMISVSGRINAAAKHMADGWKPVARKAFLLPAGLLSETLGASLLTVPVIMLTFHQISLVTLFSNLTEVPFSLFVTLTTACIVVLTPLRLLFFLIPPLGFLTRVSCSLMIWFASLLASLPFASISSSYGYLNIFLLFVALIAAAYLYFRNKGGTLAPVAGCCCLALSIGMFSHMVASGGVLEISELPVGDGECTVLIEDGGAVVIGLSGYHPEYDVKSILKERNIRRVEALVLPDYSEKAVDSANNLISAVPCGAVFAAPAYRNGQGSILTFIDGPQSVLILKNVRLDFVPDGDALDTRVSYGESSILLPGGKKPDFSTGFCSNPDVLLLNGTVTADSAKKIRPKIVLATGDHAALYSCAPFEIAGSTVKKTSEDGLISLLTRGNGKYILRNR